MMHVYLTMEVYIIVW